MAQMHTLCYTRHTEAFKNQLLFLLHILVILQITLWMQNDPFCLHNWAFRSPLPMKSPIWFYFFKHLYYWIIFNISPLFIPTIINTVYSIGHTVHETLKYDLIILRGVKYLQSQKEAGNCQDSHLSCTDKDFINIIPQ